jgi:SAM-dependent methyltransferase
VDDTLNDSRAADHGAHWDSVYRTRADAELSWHQDQPKPSLRAMDAAGVTSDQSVIDVGGGTSTLVDALLDRGVEDITVLDVSAVALDLARHRLGPRSDLPTWVCSDILTFAPSRSYEVWHDRAVFHFLVDPSARKRYVDLAVRATAPGATVVLATFAADAAPTCSGIVVARYGLEEQSLVMPASFEVVFAEREEHRTPGGTVQPFSWVAWHRHHG